MFRSHFSSFFAFSRRQLCQFFHGVACFSGLCSVLFSFGLCLLVVNGFSFSKGLLVFLSCFATVSLQFCLIFKSSIVSVFS